MRTEHTYLRSEPSTWTHGLWLPTGKWIPLGDHRSEAAAIMACAKHNGGVSMRELVILLRAWRTK